MSQKQVLVNIVIFFVQLSSALKHRCYSNFDFTIDNEKYQSTMYQKIWMNTCSKQLESICRKSIGISYTTMEPFTSKEPITKTNWPSKDGLLHQILLVALAECCGNCLNLTFTKVRSHEHLTKVPLTEQIAYPVFLQYNDFSNVANQVIPLAQLSSAMFITKSKISAKIFASQLVSAIIDIWPLLGVSFLLAFASGVIMWSIDTWWNKEHFPRDFKTGAFEGFWWAFITMTTVGYGDRVPKSIPGRLFATFWILIGLSLVALTTAAMTTAISTVATNQMPSMDRGNIGLLQHHKMEKSMLMHGNSKKIYKDTIMDLVAAIHSGEIDGMLIDTYTAKSFMNSILKTETLYVDSIVHNYDQFMIGVTLHDGDLRFLLQEYFEYHKEEINDYIFDSFQSINEPNNPIIIANLIFTTQSGMFWPVVILCSIILFGTLVIGGLYELHRSKRNKNKEIKGFQITLKSLMTEEERFKDEIDKLLEKWNKNLRFKMKSYLLQGQFHKTNTSYATVSIHISPTIMEKDLSEYGFTENESTPERITIAKEYEKNNTQEIQYNESIENIEENVNNETAVETQYKPKSKGNRKGSTSEYHDEEEQNKKREKKKTTTTKRFEDILPTFKTDNNPNSQRLPTLKHH